MARRYRITIDVERIDTNGVNGAELEIIPEEKEEGLTDQEMEVITLLTRGLSNKLIARNLGITESTVKVHFKRIFKKIGVENRTQAAFWAVRQRIGVVVTNELEEDR